MLENVPATLELKETQLKYLDEMVDKYALPDRSKALRCLITFAMQEQREEQQQASIFSEIRCVNC